MARAATIELDPEVEAVWGDWFNLKKTSIKDALSIFQISTDIDSLDDEEAESETAVPYVSFNLRPRQDEALDTIERYFWGLKKRAARLVVLKSRRYGMTTFFIMLGLERILRVVGYQVLLIAQDDKMAEYHFQRLRDTLKQIPVAVLTAHGIEIVQDTKHQVILRHGDSRTSSFTVAPAKRNALGRGGQYNAIFVTEYPVWPKSAKRDLSGVLRACRNVRGNIICFESTAHGYEEFHRRYTRAVKRKSDYRAMFIASYEHPGNRKPFDSPEAETEFIKKIGTEKEFGAEDETVLFRKLTVDLRWPFSEAAQFLHWRRATLVDDCEGSVDNLHREEPNTPDEAFAGTGIPLFKKEILEAWRTAAEEREAHGKKCRLMIVGKEIKVFDEMQADLVVYERPSPGRRFAFGADVASGIAQHADGRTEADFSVCVVKDVRTKRTVARLRLHIPPTEFAELVFRLACWYGGARGYIERSINDSGVCINHFEDLEFGEHWGSQLLLSQKTLIKTDTTNVRANYKYVPGFKTTHKSKPKLVDNIRKEINEFGLPDGEKECPYDIQFVSEGMTFERDDRTGQMGASTGHDDCVIAEGLCLESIEFQLAEGSDDAPPPPTGPLTGDAILLEHCRRNAAHRAEEDHANAISDLPDF